MNEEFTSAEVQYPKKLVINKNALKAIMDNKLYPIHPQIYPTNRCNLNCSFCSCSDRDKSKELDLEVIKKFILKYLNYSGSYFIGWWRANNVFEVCRTC